MHIIVGILTAVAGLIWALVALQKSGFRLSSFNPFQWYRRNQWRKKSGEKAIYTLQDPMEVAAVLLLGVAKCEGEITTTQKNEILKIFQQEFKLDSNEASDLLLASAHLIRNEIYLSDNLKKIMARCGTSFTPEQFESLLSLMTTVAKIESPVNKEQDKLIEGARSYFASIQAKPDSKW